MRGPISQKTLTDELLERLADLDDSLRDGLDLRLEEQVRYCFADYLGVALLGSALESDLLDGAARWMAGGNVPVLGTEACCSAQDAAFLMALQAHSAELDDGHRKGMIHPGAVVFSSLLAVAPVVGARWGDFSRSAVLGYEVAILLAEAVQPAHKLAGFHATATCGAAGAAVAASSLLGSNRSTWKTSLAIALSGANGLLETINKESGLKPVNAARAAMLGVNAVILASCGIKGPDDIIGGERGFVACMTSSCKSVELPPEGDPQILEVYFKPYASCRHCHSGVEAALRIAGSSNFLLSDVLAVGVETYDLAIKGHVEKGSLSVSAAKMSIPASIALALATGRGDVFDEDLLADGEVRRVIEATEVFPSEELSRLVPDKRAAVVTVRTKDGRTLTERVDYPKGEPENPMSEEELMAKFLGCAAKAHMSRDDAEALFEGVMNAGSDDRIEDLLRLAQLGRRENR